MENSYSTIEEAEKAWKGPAWKGSRALFTRPGEACICEDKKRIKPFFIILHPDCVDYRKKNGDFVKSLV